MTAIAPYVSAAIERLRASDPQTASLSEAVCEELLALTDTGAITQLIVQRFAWIHIPQLWPAAASEMVDALARLLDECGLPRYAAVCRSAETASVLSAYRRSIDRGVARSERAEERSAIAPPHLDGLGWTIDAGPDEREAYRAVSATLEFAVVTGDLVPGRRGWRQRREALGWESLQRVRTELAGCTWLTRIVRERVQAWLYAGGPDRLALLAPRDDGFVRAGEVPEDLSGLAPALWLLDRAVSGVCLDDVGHPCQEVVDEAGNLFGLDESQSLGVKALVVLAGLLTDVGFTRVTGRSMRVTPLGRDALADPGAVWRAIASAPWTEHTCHNAVAELALAWLLSEGPASELEIAERVNPMMADLGWRVTSTLRPAPVRETRLSIIRFVMIARPLGLITVDGEWQTGEYPNRLIALTALGASTAREVFRARAITPKAPRSRERG